MKRNIAKPTIRRHWQKIAFVYVAIALLTLSCDSGTDNQEAGAEYKGGWELETPIETTAAVSSNSPNGGPQTVNIDGLMNVNLEFLESGTLDILLEFTSITPPLCSTDNPCQLQNVPSNSYSHQHLGYGVTPEGLEASRVKIINEDTSQYTDGYAVVSDGRLCISYGLWELILPSHSNTTPDSLATDFDRCFIHRI